MRSSNVILKFVLSLALLTNTVTSVAAPRQPVQKLAVRLGYSGMAAPHQYLVAEKSGSGRFHFQLCQETGECERFGSKWGYTQEQMDSIYKELRAPRMRYLTRVAPQLTCGFLLGAAAPTAAVLALGAVGFSTFGADDYPFIALALFAIYSAVGLKGSLLSGAYVFDWLNERFIKAEDSVESIKRPYQVIKALGYLDKPKNRVAEMWDGTIDKPDAWWSEDKNVMNTLAADGSRVGLVVLESDATVVLKRLSAVLTVE